MQSKGVPCLSKKVFFWGVGEDSAYCVPGTVVEADNIMRVKTERSNPLGIDGGRTQSSGYIKSAESNHVSSVSGVKVLAL